MNISILNSPDAASEDFILKMPNAKLEHTPAWSDMINRTFGHKTFYLVTREGESIQGVLPLTCVQSRIFGNRMISQAFSNYGGILADNPDAAESLYNKSVELAVENDCKSIEFRNIEPLNYGLNLCTDKIVLYLALTTDVERLWQSFVPKVRNQVRKAQKSSIYAINGSMELLDDFYKVWTVRMHQLGTPCYPRKLFHNILATFPDDTLIFLVRLDKLTIGGAFVYCFQGFVQIRWAATLTEYNTLCPNNLLYWSVMRHFCSADASCFDFGRTTVGSGQHKFKKQWGAKQIQLNTQYWVRPGQKLSLARPDNPKYKNKVEIWKKLPLWFTRFAGPYISCNLP